MSKAKKAKTEPAEIFSEYRAGTDYKASIGDNGIFEQSKRNERFFVGDQWYGANCGNSRPLVRRNLIKRIGEWKLSAISSAPIAVSYSAEGTPQNESLKQLEAQYMSGLQNGAHFAGEVDDAEINTVMSVLSKYFGTTAERVKFDDKKEEALRKAYISGTAVAYTYWDERIKTGLYADAAKQTPIDGDISFEILNVENVVFGDPNNPDIQSQPYIIVSQRLDAGEVKREARRNRAPEEEIERIQPDNAGTYDVNAGTRGEEEPPNSRRVTVLTKFYKRWDDIGESCAVMCVRVCENAVVKKAWDTGLRLYPFAKMVWSPRYNSAYGDSDITYQIPNQIAVNRALSAEIWSVMTAGIPTMLVNGDTVTEKITNNPGQIIKIFGSNEDVAGAVHYVSPPAFSAQLINAVNDLSANTLTDSGANDAALGNVNPDNATAIIQAREASLQPIQLYQNRFYSFVEDIARIWCDFWMHLYGERMLKVSDDSGTYYVRFEPSRYENLLITARIDVGSSPIWSVAATISTLNNLFAAGIIDKVQFLERIPDGIIDKKNELIEQARAEAEMQARMMEAQLQAQAGASAAANTVPAGDVYQGDMPPGAEYEDIQPQEEILQ